MPSRGPQNDMLSVKYPKTIEMRHASRSLGIEFHTIGIAEFTVGSRVKRVVDAESQDVMDHAEASETRSPFGVFWSPRFGV